MRWVQHVALGMILVTYFAFWVFSLAWFVNGGGLLSVKPGDWLAKTLYWHGAGVLVVLILLEVFAALWIVGYLVLGDF